MGKVARDKSSDLDGCYSWFILLGCWLMYLLVVGGTQAFATVFLETSIANETPTEDINWMWNYPLIIMLALGPFANYLSRRFSFRIVCLAGGLFVSLGSLSYFGLSKLIPLCYVFLAYGILTGIGCGLCFAPCSTIISFYFENRRGFANGFTVTAGSIGPLALPFLFRFVVSEYGLMRTFLIYGGFLLNICVAACFFRQPARLETDSIIEKGHRNVNGHVKNAENATKNAEKSTLLNGGGTLNRRNVQSQKQHKRSCDGFIKLSLFCKPLFTIYALAFLLCMIGYSANVMLIPTHVLKHGHSAEQVFLYVTIIKGSETLGRLFFGSLADLFRVSARKMFMCSMLIAAIFSFAAPYVTHFYFMCAYSAAIGVFPGSFWSLISVLLLDFLSLEDLTPAFGLVSLCLAIGAAVSRFFIGYLEIFTSSEQVTFFTLGGVFVLSALLLLLIPPIKHRIKQTRRRKDMENERRILEVVPLRNSCRQKSLLYLPPTPDKREQPEVEDYEKLTITSKRVSKIYRPFGESDDELDYHDGFEKRNSAPIANLAEV
ncbi:monocarboxylate transporter 12-like [Dreissena polymorpha]|uniref:Major facilitator superfamily (MFS) profile domain-containing protein n=1 Tax=Dreissena polymorpha TaxID=45954 RepID=A0A9D4LC73_DREPO|nr:monocarboxylate transporter 12-like [Dreissena polymorpha]XP_052269468.1 monocarboxylate transporter 12-like [Dreissena polymorpha]XP_052269469.1 monocarboxylate transporter 12-like [Dreissena polymorpha]KAH3855144.1 hypothetical protein DPMN_097705 [Dreissena polymorpha]